MARFEIWLVVAFIPSLVAGYNSLSTKQVSEAKTRLRTVLKNYKAVLTTPGGGNGGLTTPLLATAVRLNFHDCVGGCDGCINFANEDNKGLEPIVKVLGDVYDKEGFSAVMSRADFWALAGIAALELAAENQRCRGRFCSVPKPSVTFKWGRKDCASSPTTKDMRELPNNHGDLAHVKKYFREEFGLNTREVVALMGAHTLGAAHRNQSGFAGRWVPRRDELSNQFYQILVNPNFNWTQSGFVRPQRPLRPFRPFRPNRPTPPPRTPKYQWDGNPVGFMLNTDVCLYKNLKLEADGKSKCTFNTCGASETASIVSEYAANNALWMKEFSKVYEKMISNGYDDLKLPG
ncbi:putative ascorbate peroxidase [Lingula anatina]|uniref:Ascorbate peroxidase n=1 Tax=Lingula anatina TaxID=7574 RepID=A0A1S3JDH4_LINAN|nr:putative ascorbate peroxidase [Lingula anatina]|eukprot:XP_013408457.1 putative ascorbate peroxidase [Lingula anatina]